MVVVNHLYMVVLILQCLTMTQPLILTTELVSHTFMGVQIIPPLIIIH